MPIPRVIHQVWIGDKLPDNKQALTNSMQIHGFEYRLWGNKDLTQRNFPLMWPYIQTLQNAKQPISMVVDLMKFEIIYHNGGFYFDVNVELLRPEALHDFAINQYLVLCNEKPEIRDFLSCAFFAAAPEHPALRKVLDHVMKGDLNLKSGFANLTTGPYLFYRVLDDKPQHLMLATHEIYPFPPGSKKTCKDCKAVCPDSIAVDHFELGCTWCARVHAYHYKIAVVCGSAVLIAVLVVMLLYHMT